MSNILFKDILGVKDLESFEPVDNEKELEYVRGYGCETVEEFKSLYLGSEKELEREYFLDTMYTNEQEVEEACDFLELAVAPPPTL